MRVIVIGSGIGGLSTAIALRRRGIDAQVYERSAELRDVGAGISLWPNAVKALRKLSLGDLLSPISLAGVDTALRRWDGTFLSRTSAHDLERRFGGGIIILHRAELLAMLARSAGFANIHLGHELSDIDTNGVGVNAGFTNGSVAEGDVLIGADGIYSTVRHWLGHVKPPLYAGYTVWRAVVPFDQSRLVPAETWGPGRRFGAFPVQGNRVYWYATKNAPEGEEHDRPKATLRTLFAGWHEPVEDLIAAADESTILRNDVYDANPLGEWGRGRVTLLGDAAHPMTPNLGQGACQAIEDALELAARLAAGGASPESALEEYEKRRIPRTSAVVLDSRRLGRIAQIDDTLQCLLRDTALRLLPGFVHYRSLAGVIGYEKHLVD